MKRKMTLTITLIFAALSLLYSAGAHAADPENKAIDRIASSILDKKEKLKDRKIGMFDFSSLDGKETPEGKRISGKLLERLIGKGTLVFVERSEINKLLKANEIEQTGIVDADSIREGVKVLPIDVMITGTIAILGNKEGEISVKGVNISSGEIYFMINQRFEPEKGFTYKEDQQLLDLHKASPEKAGIVQNTYNGLMALSAKRPMIFLGVVLNEKELAALKNDRPRMFHIIQQKKNETMKNNPAAARRLARLRKGLDVLQKSSPEKYGEVMKKKDEILARKGRNKDNA